MPVPYWSPYYTPGVLHVVYSEEALGSNLGLIRERRLSGTSFSSFLS